MPDKDIPTISVNDYRAALGKKPLPQFNPAPDVPEASDPSKESWFPIYQQIKGNEKALRSVMDVPTDPNKKDQFFRTLAAQTEAGQKSDFEKNLEGQGHFGLDPETKRQMGGGQSSVKTLGDIIPDTIDLGVRAGQGAMAGFETLAQGADRLARESGVSSLLDGLTGIKDSLLPGTAAMSLAEAFPLGGAEAGMAAPHFSTPAGDALAPDVRAGLNAEATELFQKGATRPQFDAWTDSKGLPRYGEELDKSIAARDSAKAGPTAVANDNSMAGGVDAVRGPDGNWVSLEPTSSASSPEAGAPAANQVPLEDTGVNIFSDPTVDTEFNQPPPAANDAALSGIDKNIYPAVTDTFDGEGVQYSGGASVTSRGTRAERGIPEEEAGAYPPRAANDTTAETPKPVSEFVDRILNEGPKVFDTLEGHKFFAENSSAIEQELAARAQPKGTPETFSGLHETDADFTKFEDGKDSPYNEEKGVGHWFSAKSTWPEDVGSAMAPNSFVHDANISFSNPLEADIENIPVKDRPAFLADAKEKGYDGVVSPDRKIGISLDTSNIKTNKIYKKEGDSATTVSGEESPAPMGAADGAGGGEKPPANEPPAGGGEEPPSGPPPVPEHPKPTEEQGPLQRRVLARNKLESARAASKLEKHQRVVANATVDEQRSIVNAVEGGPEGIAALPEKFQAAANSIREVAQGYKKTLEKVLGKKKDGLNYIENYYSRMWKQTPQQVSAAMSRTGSARNLRARSGGVPTYQDGLDRDLTPVHENPIDGMTAYVDNMSQYLAVNDLQKQMKSSGLAKMFPSSKIPEGWVALNGRDTTQPTRIIIKDGKTVHVPEKTLAARKADARIYNNYVDPGFTGPVYKALNKASQIASQSALGLSLFHPTLVAGKAFSSDLMRGVNHVLSGSLLEGFKTIVGAPFAPFSSIVTDGVKMKGRLLTSDEVMTKLDHLYVDAGGRSGADDVYRAGLKPNLFKSFERGTMKKDLQDAVTRLYKGNVKENLSGFVDTVSQVADTLNAPTFQMYVPAVKKGVFMRELADELKRNPDWTDAQQKAAARRILDSVDSRMGEMVKDNHFWKTKTEQVARMLLLSPSWNIGLINLAKDGIGGIPASVKSIVKGKGLQGDTAALAGIAAGSLLMNGIANYLYTGEAPTGADWMHFRTGGKNKDGSPERAMIPSSMKDVYALAYDFPHNIEPEIMNKANPALRSLFEVATNKDYFGNPIVRPAHAVETDKSKAVEGSRFDQVLKYLTTKGPITMQPVPGGQDSNIGPLGRVLGLRPSGLKYANPERDMAMQQMFESQAWNRKVGMDAKRQAADQGDIPTISRSQYTAQVAAAKNPPATATADIPTISLSDYKKALKEHEAASLPAISVEDYQKTLAKAGTTRSNVTAVGVIQDLGLKTTDKGIRPEKKQAELAAKYSGVAAPGTSHHEDGRAIDIETPPRGVTPATIAAALKSKGFQGVRIITKRHGSGPHWHIQWDSLLD